MTAARWKCRSGVMAMVAASMLGLGGILLKTAVAAEQGGVHPGPMSRADAYVRAAALTELGRKMFFDPSLSASGKQACASCHDPHHAFGRPGDVVAALQKGAYAEDLSAKFGATVFDNRTDAFNAAVEALGTFEQSSSDFLSLQPL
jgi:cytochrome c peroxidase